MYNKKVVLFPVDRQGMPLVAFLAASHGVGCLAVALLSGKVFEVAAFQSGLDYINNK